MLKRIWLKVSIKWKITFICLRYFKNRIYYFNKYDTFDLLIMIPLIIIRTLLSVVSLSFMSDGNFTLSMIGLSVGLLVVGITLILFMPYRIYHNIMNRLLVEIHFQLKQKEYMWYGYDFNNYED